MNCLQNRRFLAAAIVVTVVCAAHGSAQDYKQVATYQISAGSAMAAAVDATGRRLYVAGSGGVAVLNVDTGRQLGTIAGIHSATDVLLVSGTTDGGKVGFAVNDDGVTIFSLQTGRSTRTIPISGASRLCFDPFSDQVIAVGQNTMASVNAVSGQLVNSGNVHAGEGQIACGTLGHVYAADPDANVVHVLNHKTLKNDGDYSMTVGRMPVGLTLDTRGRRLFVACKDGTIEILDTDAGFSFSHMDSGSGVAHGLFVWTPQGKDQWKAGAFFSHDDGTLTGIRMMAYIRYVPGGEWKIAPGEGGLAYDEKTHHLIVVSGSSGSASVAVLGN